MCFFGGSPLGRPQHASKKLSETPRPHSARTPRSTRSNPAPLSSLLRSLRGEDLLIAIARPPPATSKPLAIAIAGRGFDGDLTSDSTRTDGYVLSTDVAPTILARLGVEVPAADVRATDPGRGQRRPGRGDRWGSGWR